jgi:hypothetical protein
VLGVDGRRPTLKWNGYGDFVAHLYDCLEKSAFRFDVMDDGRRARRGAPQVV